MIVETDLMAAEAGLVYVESGAPGLHRMRRGRGFSYVDESGKVVGVTVKERIESLAIPPAWEDVWICPDRRGHIQATGHDKAGRKQYIYHPQWEEIRDEVKFDRMVSFGANLSRMRRRIAADLRKRGSSQEKVVALAVAVLDRTLIRVGNRRYAAENDSYGLTTLTPEHIEVAGRHVNIHFNGKGQAERQLVVAEPRLARLIGECQELSGQTLFSYETPNGGLASVTSDDVNRYLEVATSMPVTAKDFRTWGASATVVGLLGPGEDDLSFLGAVDVAAERLGNTRTVCRSSYVHPLIESVAGEDRLSGIWKRARPGKWVDRPESALRLLLEESK